MQVRIYTIASYVEGNNFSLSDYVASDVRYLQEQQSGVVYPSDFWLYTYCSRLGENASTDLFIIVAPRMTNGNIVFLHRLVICGPAHTVRWLRDGSTAERVLGSNVSASSTRL